MPYFVRRSLLVVPTLVGISFLTFVLATVAPGNAAETLIRRVEGRAPLEGEVAMVEHELGLDRPFMSRYAGWLRDVANGDLGTSFTTRRPVTHELARRVPQTLRLAVPAALVALLLAIPVATICSLWRNRAVDQLVRVLSLASASMPSFWLGLLLITAFAVRWSLVPAGGRAGLSSYALPVLTLALEPAAVLARFARSNMLETLSEDYVRTARSKGLAEWAVVARHAMRNALVPAVTYFGARLAGLLTGAVIVETIFGWPGIGALAAEAVAERDYPMLQGIVLFSGLTFAVLNLVVDLSYGLIDPRIRLGRTPGRAS